MNLTAAVARGAAECPERAALQLPSRTLAYAELETALQRTAGALRGLGIESGDRVALFLGNGEPFVLAYLAAIRLGAVAVPVNVQNRGAELAHCLKVSGARALVFAGRLAGIVEEARAEGPLPEILLAAERAPEGVPLLEDLTAAAEPWPDLPDLPASTPAAMVFTHAVDGFPRGAVLSHGSLAVNAEDSAHHFQLGAGCRVMTGLPLYHTYGATAALLTPLSARGTAQILERFRPAETLQAIQDWKPQVFAGVPTMYAAILGLESAGRHEIGSVRLWISGGMALPRAIQIGFERLAGNVMREGYGLTEASPVCAFNYPPQPRKIGSIGLPFRSLEARIAAPGDPLHAALPPGTEGELVVRGPNVMLGYHEDPKATAEKLVHGWLRTGDKGFIDEAGYIFLTGLYKPMFLTDGFNVYTEEVRRYLAAMPEIAEVRSLDAVPDLAHGQLVRAEVRLAPGLELSAEELTALARRRMALYKVPRIWGIVRD